MAHEFPTVAEILVRAEFLSPMQLARFFWRDSDLEGRDIFALLPSDEYRAEFKTELYDLESFDTED